MSDLGDQWSDIVIHDTVMESKMSKYDILYLCGAGSSYPAHLPTMKKMTDEFYSEVRSGERCLEIENQREKIEILDKIVVDLYHANDLESLMTVMIELRDDQKRILYEGKYPEIKIILPNSDQIQSAIQNYMRSKLDSVNSNVVDYLSPLIGLIPADHPMDIFTLNYDGIFEILAEKYDIQYTDGFSPFWNPKELESKDFRIRIFKLHGSLYWLRTESGKIIRIPIKGLQTNRVKYLSDESLSEMMIYPALQKEKYSEVYSYLSQSFITKLNTFDICVVIGYSFRDKDITQNIFR